MKYIIIREPDGARFPFLFCAPFTHSEIGLMLQGQRHGRIIESAGFVEFLGPDAVRCFGRSESLNIATRPEDSALVAAFARATLMTVRATTKNA